MKASLKRFALVLLTGLLFFEAILEFAVSRPESWEELATMGLFGLIAVGLVWAVLPAFGCLRLRVPLRAGLFLIYVVTVTFVSNVYSWHIRPNIGLYKEPAWVAQHPGFQRQLQARIERNRW